MINNKKMENRFIEILELLGISKEKIISLEKPTRFKNVIIPDNCEKVNYFYTKEYKKIFDRLIENALSKPITIEPTKRIYISSNLWLPSKKRDIGSDQIENFFNINGFKSIFPEKLSVVEQIQLIYNAQEIATLVSSTALNLVYASHDSKVFLCYKGHEENKYVSLVVEAKKLNVTYIDAHRSFLPGVDSSGGPFLLAINYNLIKFAKDHCMEIPKCTFLKNISLYISEWISKFRLEEKSIRQKRIKALKLSAKEYIDFIKDLILSLIH